MGVRITHCSSNRGSGVPLFHPSQEWWRMFLSALCVGTYNSEKFVGNTHVLPPVCRTVERIKRGIKWGTTSERQLRTSVYFSCFLSPTDLMDVLNTHIYNIPSIWTKQNRNRLIIKVPTLLTNLSDQQFHYCWREELNFGYSVVVKRLDLTLKIL